MEFGLFSNNRRPDRPIGEAWDEDIFEAEVADRLGFHEIWFSEHQSPAELIICKAAGRTHRIRLCSGVISLPYHHPLMVADRVAFLDHMTTGRVTAVMSENVLQYPGNVDASGAGVSVYASANTFYSTNCFAEPVAIYTFANNAVSGGYPTCSVTKVGGS